MGTVNEKIKIRGLAVLSSWIFLLWGGLIAIKGIYDLFLGEPEANLYAPQAWAFVTREQWARYGGFELFYGLVCLGLGWYLLRYSAFLPETVMRPRTDAE